MTAKRVASKFGIEQQGFADTGEQHWNLTPAALYEHAIKRGEGTMAEGGALVCMTGIHTGRSPQDKFTVEEDQVREHIDWGKFNKPIAPEYFAKLRQLVQAHIKGRELFVRDCYAGADPNYRLNVRVITERAWHNIFAGNMFIQPPADDLPEFEPEFTVIQVPSCEADPEIHGTRTGTFIVVSLEHRLVLIGGTEYAGEIKKSIFGVLNYMLPERGVMPMHCSANIGAQGDVAVFFGLSGTGKTTLSADPHRTLIGDDEHGWSENGVFNFEGGCYAKVVKLDPLAEPEIYATTQRFGTILENVTMDPVTRLLDLDDTSNTENTRASYPLDFIPNASETGMGGHPRNIIMLTADAFGVLPPISKLTPEQAMYHFLSGYTAKVAGTEKGVTEPEATFSTCFGAPFMPRRPTEYAKLLGEMMSRHNVDCWLVNTGWSGGAYGTGERMKIGYTRAMVRAALNGDLAKVGTAADPVFGLHVPDACPDVPGEVLVPRRTWDNVRDYDHMAAELAQRFQQNFAQYETHVDAAVKKQAIHVAA